MELKLRNLTKKYGNFTALSQLSVTFTPGIYGILGANGAGKSTIMNLISDNLKRSTGEILWNGQEILSLGRKFRKVLGFMPQQQGYYDRMTVDFFLRYLSQLKGIPKKQADQEIRILLQKTNLSDVCHKQMTSLSGGMKQRVLLIQALLGNPKVVLLDEPTAGLDPKERIRIRNLISEFSQGRIILLATHIVSDIEFISDKILLMKNGELVRMGSTEELLMSVADKVRELPCDPGQLPELESRYKVGNVSRRQGHTVARLVGDDLPPESKNVADRLTLEDVYLYYLEESQLWNGNERFFQAVFFACCSVLSC